MVPGAVQQSRRALALTSVALRADWGVVYTAVLQDRDALEFSSEALQADRQMALTAEQQRGHAWHAAPEAR